MLTANYLKFVSHQFIFKTFVAFKDIKPASKFHFLVIPKKHIPNVKSLTLSDKEMGRYFRLNKFLANYLQFIFSVESMKRIMLEILASNSQTDLDQISLGFHLPPFNSIKHLHLHGISPKSDVGFIGRMIFRENSWWYQTVDSVIRSLPAES